MNEKVIKVIFFGDSICVGQGVSVHKGWVTRISSALVELEQELGKKILLMNASVNGNTTRLALERMPYDVQSHSPDIAIVQFGMNDCNYWATDKGVPRVSLKAFIANIDEIINRCFSHGAKHIMLNNNHPTTRTNSFPNLSFSYEDSNSLYNDQLREFASKFSTRNMTFNDMNNVFKARLKGSLSEFLLTDELHLSEKGHDVYYENIYPKLKEIIVREF